jgi:hypothetical protein
MQNQAFMVLYAVLEPPYTWLFVLPSGIEILVIAYRWKKQATLYYQINTTCVNANMCVMCRSSLRTASRQMSHPPAQKFLRFRAPQISQAAFTFSFLQST